jgi:hypothetical protein
LVTKGLNLTGGTCPPVFSLGSGKTYQSRSDHAKFFSELMLAVKFSYDLAGLIMQGSVNATMTLVRFSSDQA